MVYCPPKNVESLLQNRYFQEGENWEALCRRVAKAAASVEKTDEEKVYWEERFYQMLVEARGLPNTPALINMGAKHVGSAAACFSFRPEDTMQSILETGRLAAMTLKYGGGVGFECSLLRPENFPIQSTHKYAMGPVGVMKYFDSICDMVTQGGVRKSAAIAILSIDHPDIIKFCRAKEKDKVLTNFNISVSVTDGFMKKLITSPEKPHICKFNGKQYHLLQSGESIVRTDRDSKKVLSVAEVFELICKGAASNGDPGIFFVDHANKNNPLLDGPGDTTNRHYLHGTNPCIPGEQKVYVADGREFVTIKELAEKGDDVPVFCLDNEGCFTTKIMRHPRVTGYNQKILKVTLDDGSSFRCTPNHKIMMIDGSYKEAKDFVSGERIKHLRRVKEPNGPHDYWRVYGVTDSVSTAEHQTVAAFKFNKPLLQGEVVHHKDGDSLNNNPENLLVLTTGEHSILHSESFAGEKNGRYIDISNEDYFQRAIDASKNLGRLFSRREWQSYCKREGLPMHSQYRLTNLGFETPEKLLYAAAEKADVFRDTEKLKSYRLYLNLKDTYDWPVRYDEEKGVIVIKKCECCNSEFEVRWAKRENGFCSRECTLKISGMNYLIPPKERAAVIQKETRLKQTAVFSDLKKELQREPMRKEWENRCKEEKIPFRLQSNSDCNEYCFKTFAEVKQAAETYLNFKIVSVEEDGIEDVYNGTVDEYHNFIVMTDLTQTRTGREAYSLVTMRNCGELPLENRGACLLGSIDLAKFVIDKELDSNSLSLEFETMTRLLDNMIDISVWPDPAIKETVEKTRRIGVGVMGFTSMLDKLGIRYGSEKCLDLIEILGKIREEACDKQSKKLAQERGVYLAAKEGEEFRNIARTVIAPTGSLAMIANTSWSLEPHLYWAFLEKRNNESKVRYLSTVEELLGFEMLDSLSELANGDLEELNRLIQINLPEHMVTSKNITPEEHLSIVAAWQKYTHSAISKTIVASEEVLTTDKVTEIYKFAWENKLKGLTVYPEGSREGEPMSLNKKKRKICSRPKKLMGTTSEHEISLDGKFVKAFCTVNEDPDKPGVPYEIILKHPQVQDHTAIQFIDMSTRLLSILLRYRHCDCGEEVVPLGEIIKQLKKTDGLSLFSVPSILSQSLQDYAPEGEVIGTCPNCKAELTVIEHCSGCRSCGYRACG